MAEQWPKVRIGMVGSIISDEPIPHVPPCVDGAAFYGSQYVLCESISGPAAERIVDLWNSFPVDWKNWIPSPANVNSLPEPLRGYIHDLETRCDPAGEVAALTLTKDQNRQLQAVIVDLQDKLQKAEAAVQTVVQDAFRKLCEIYEAKAAEYAKRAQTFRFKRDKLYSDCYREMALNLRKSFGLVVSQ